MNEEYSKINDFLVTVFHEVLRTEEESLQTKSFKNLSIREMHIIVAVCKMEKTNSNNATNIALSQNVTSGTLATAIKTLERKGYVKREHDSQDKRVVRIISTDKGKAANEVHSEFHQQLVLAIMSALTPKDLAVFVKGLAAVQRFFKEKRRTKKSMTIRS